MELKLVEDTGDVFHFVLPPELNTQLSDKQHGGGSGGVCFGLIPGRPRLFGLTGRARRRRPFPETDCNRERKR